jgi:hypothetical protein
MHGSSSYFSTFVPEIPNIKNMKKMLLTAAIAASASAMMAQECVELFISEYVEGWGNNKAIELYNPTASAITLSNYRLERYSNGSSSADANQRYTLPNETIAPFSTYVVVIDKRNAEGEGQEQPVWTELQEKADHFANPVYNDNNTMYFNGNDAVVLRNMTFGTDGFVVDIFGRLGEDPGNPSEGGGWNNVPPAYTWINNGSEPWSTDHSLIRKFDVTVGNFAAPLAIWNVAAEWDSIPAVVVGEAGFLTGNWASLGIHDCACFPLSVSSSDVQVGKVYPNPVPKSGLLQFSAPYSTIRYEVFDLSGKLVDSKVVPSLQLFEINTTALGQGMYLLRTYAENGVFANKFILE